MKEDYQELVRKISLTLRGNIQNSIDNFVQGRQSSPGRTGI